MPLGLIRKIAARLLGGSTAKPATPAVKRGAPASARPHRPEGGRDGRRPHPEGRANERRPPRVENRPSRPASPPREPSAGEAPRRDEAAPRPPRGENRPPRPAEGGRPEGRRDERREPRRDERRDDRRGGGRPDDRRGGRGAWPRNADARLEQGHTPRGETRPGGAIGADEQARRQTAHADWSLESFQVAPAEGKKRFHDFNLPAEIMHAIADAKFEYCTPIQAQSLEHALAGRNVAGRAQTGTGKTAAFLIALLTRYLRQPSGRPTQAGAPRALVIAPTRELVIQIGRDADMMGRYCGLRYLAIYGGMDHERQRREIEAGPIDLLVATPGRLLDYANSHTVNLSQVDTLVIDEADRMLDMGFIPDVRRIVRLLPAPDKRCTMLYSATLNDDVMRLASQWMSAPVRVDIEHDHVAVETVTQQVYVVAARDKITLLINLLRRHADRRVLIFCNRRISTERVAERLQRCGIACEMLSGDVQQNRRLRALEDFRAGKIRVVVATDVAGRGIHVDDIGFVINFDFPYEPEDYVHRIGRTGRAGHQGTAISFADENESFAIPEIEKFIGEPLKCMQPEDELLRPVSERGERHPAREPAAHRERTPAPEPAAAPHVGHAPECEGAPAPEAKPHPHPQAHVAPAATPAAPAPASEPIAVTPVVAPVAAPAKPQPAAPVASASPRPAPAAPRPPLPAIAPSAVRRTTEEWVPGGGKR